MNKNTLLGLLLMGAVIMVFMYLYKPTPEQIDAARRAQQEQMAAENKTDQGQPITIDSVTAAQRQQYAATIRQEGVLDTLTGLYTLTSGNVRLTVSADSSARIGGEIKVGSTVVPASDVFNASYGNIDKSVAAQAVNELRQAVDDVTRFKGFNNFRTGSDSATVSLRNDVLALTISSRGGVIRKAELLDKKYNKYDGGQVCPVAPGDDMYGFVLQGDNVQYDTRDLYFDAIQESDSTVLMSVTPGDGVMLGIRYTLPKGDAYTVRMELVQKDMTNIIPVSVSGMDFVWKQRMARNEVGRVFESDNSAIYYMTAGGDVDNLNEHSDATEDIKDPLQWVAFKNQFFTSLLVADEGFNSARMSSTILKDNEHFLKDMSFDSRMNYSSALEMPASFTFFIGPNSYPLLSDLSDNILPEKDLKLTKLLPLGWPLFRWINTWIVIPVFDFLGKYIANYGIIILLLTIFIKLILFPFTYKSYMSQAKMRVLAPEIKEINDKYPGKENAMRRQQETMALYSRAGANPMSGCLPMLLQLPILIAMFRFFPSAIELRGESFLWAADLSAPDFVIHLPFAIPFLGSNLSLFCLLMTAVNIIYTRINLQNQPGGNQMPGMKWMMYLMPVMFLVFFNNYASGLSYYYLLSLLITIVQTYVFRRIVDENKVRAAMRANASKPKKKSGFMARLEEAQRKQQAMLREQERQRGGRKGGNNKR